MRIEAEISHIWQLAHLKFYFGEKLAERLMQSADNPPMASASCRAKNEFRLNHLHHPEFLDSQPGSALFGKESANDGSGSKSSAEQRKESVTPQALNSATRIA